MNECLPAALGLGEENTPFPWQQELLKRFVEGQLPPGLDIPTGLGKTAVMAIWLVARTSGATLPGRLVYVVDRRAVVAIRRRLRPSGYDNGSRRARM
jgi:CRISPR-associated endonuclease/helicase Cas3